eukprot:3227885-Prorocentrum_lima.AAC.1
MEPMGLSGFFPSQVLMTAFDWAWNWGRKYFQVHVQHEVRGCDALIEVLTGTEADDEDVRV